MIDIKIDFELLKTSIEDIPQGYELIDIVFDKKGKFVLNLQCAVTKKVSTERLDELSSIIKNMDNQFDRVSKK